MGLKYTDEKILNKLQEFVISFQKNNIFLPKQEDLKRFDNYKTYSHVRRRFGNYRNAMLLLGYNVDTFNNNVVRKDIIDKYKSKSLDYGRPLMVRDIIYEFKIDKSFYCMTTIMKHFKSLEYLQKECGFIPYNIGNYLNEEEGLIALKQLYNDLKSIPSMLDLKECEYTPSYEFYIRRFGTYINALKLAGIDTPKQLKTKRGTICLSTYEYRLCQTLEKYNIVYDKEVSYKSVIPTYTKKHRFDFVIDFENNKYFIEIFGMKNMKKYYDTKSKKIQICKDNGIPLLIFENEDFYAKTSINIYNNLLNQINSYNRKEAV